MLASSNKLLGISRGEQQGDAKDSLRYQKVFGPVEYFAQRIQKDGGSVARSMLWKATNRGNVDFINTGSLQPHINAVFHESNLSQFVDNSTPLDSIDNSMKVTRVGQGGIQDGSEAPIEMRLVQPSYYGYISGTRTAQKCYRADTQILTKRGWIKVQDMTIQDKFATWVDGKLRWNKPEEVNSYDHDGLMYCYESEQFAYCVTPQHRMYFSDLQGNPYFISAQEAHGKAAFIFCAKDQSLLTALFSEKFYTQYYKGKVYCPTVPGGLVFVRYKKSRGFWCGNSPGLTGYLTKNVMRGTDGKLYQNMLNVRTGRIEPVDSQKAASSVVTTNEYMDTDDQFVYAMGGPKGVRVVAKKDVDYILPYSDDAESTMANNVPMYSGVKAMRLLMGCHHPQTPIIVLNAEGQTQIVPAKRLGYMNEIRVIGCDEQGNEVVFHVRKVIPRSVQKNTRFVKVILSSGRVLTTSPCHKWYVYDKEFKQIPASELSKGMLVPRSLFTSVPTKNGIVYTRRVTKQVASLMGRIVASGTATATGFKFDYACSKILHVDQKQQLTEALDYLGIADYHFFSKHGVYFVTVKDPVFVDWVQENIGLTSETKRIPGCLLSLSPGFTSYFLDSYCKTMTNLAQDRQGDNWLLDIGSASLRDSLAFMLNKIYTDTKYRDCRKNGQIQRALQLVPVNRDLADVALDSITDIQFVQPPAMMIDIDCDDNVYAAANGIITHNSKYSTQAIPLQNREAPLVRALDQQSGEDMPTRLGRMLGTQWAPKPGMVKAVRKDRIDMLYDDGTKGSVYLYQNFPANAKGWLSNYVKVKAGDKVAKGQLLASSNYTDDNGVAALGRNLRIGYMSYHGGTYEDACTLSESAAKKMAYTVMYKTGMDKDKNIRTAKSLYSTWKPGQYSKEQLDNLDDSGVVKVGTVLQPGDPMILGIRTTEASPGTLGKRILSDVTETWQHHSPGVVTDVVNSKSGIKVYATISKPLEVGDKISGAHGNKATCAQIIPDDKMPRDSKGRPLDILFDPLGIISRCYDAQTEFLTQDGWKFGQDVLDTDTLMCYDTVTGETYQTAQEDSFYRTHYNGHLIGARAKGIDFLVTPKHKMLVFKPDTGWYETTAQEVYGTQVSIPTGSKDQDIVTVEPQDWYEQPYADMVYCPTVATGYVVTRRNGAIVCLANTNPAQMMQVALGKVAQKTGKPYVVPSFMPKGQSRLQWVKQEMKKHNVKPTQDIYDPQSGRTVKNVFTGSMYFYPLKHLAQSKMSARGTDEYTSEGVPQRGSYSGSKSIGSLESSGLAGHGAFDFITQDAKLIRGQANSDFWRSIRTGQIPVVPGEPLVHKKFFAHLQGSGLNVKRSKQGISLFALSNKDVNQLAGNRELKSTDTYEQKTFREIDGGLFGRDVFGPQGNNWGYIQLDSPLPNPVMQQPLARLLRMSDAQFQAVVQGKEQVNGIGNATEMKQALQKLDLQKEADRALTQLKDARPSKRDAALKRYVAIARMRDNGVRPQQYMLDRIPVLPPKFRPISQHSDLTMVADSNYLYAQLLNARDDLREARTAGLPDQYLKDAQANIYRRWKELTGLYDPSDVKLKAKNVGGLLKWALGKSPKFSAFQRKVLGSVVDTVGRGVVVPSTKVKLNEIGMPVEMAWDVYAPFVTRKLVQRNYTPIEAMKMVKSRSRAAFDALQEAVAERPVVMNRAPSLHKLSLMGFNVRLTSGNAIKVNPSIVVPFGMDFDGDSCKSLISIELRQENTGKGQESSDKHIQKQHLTNEKYGVYYLHKPINMKGYTMITKNEKVQTLFGAMELSELPVIEGSEVKKSDTVTEWDVQPGFYANTVDPATGELTSARITKVSKHENLKMFDVKFGISGAYEHIATVSEDHSMITLDPSTLELTKTRPENAMGACVPVSRANLINRMNNGEGYLKSICLPSGEYPMSYHMGVFFGLMIGDGWITSFGRNGSSQYAAIACCDLSLQEYIKKLTARPELPFTKQAALFSYKSTKGRFSQEDMQRLSIYMSSEDKALLKELIGHGAHNKRIPAPCFLAGTDHLIGLLVGLLATDGNVSYATGAKHKKASNKIVSYTTVSPVLRDGVQELGRRLGIKTTVVPYIGTASGKQAYAVGFALEDIVRLYNKTTKFRIPVAHKEEALERIAADIHETAKAGNKKASTSYDIVPFPRGLFCEFSWAKIVDLAKDTVIPARSKGYIRRNVAKRIADALERRDWSIYKDPTYLKKADQTHRTPAQAKALVDKWIAMVRNDDIGWEVVTDVTPSTCTEGWDCTVPGPYTFTLSTGTVVQDTVNLHVPVSQAGIRDVRQKMMPQKNLIGIRKKKILYAPQKAYTQGLYVATRMGESKDVKVFDTLQDAKNAYRNGDIDVDTPIIIKDRE